MREGFQEKGFFAKSFNLFKKIVKSGVVSQNFSQAVLRRLFCMISRYLSSNRLPDDSGQIMSERFSCDAGAENGGDFSDILSVVLCFVNLGS